MAKKRLNQGAQKSRRAVKSNLGGDVTSNPKKSLFMKIPLMAILLMEVLRDRQAATSAIGACLLLAMFLFMVVAVFLGMMKPDIIANAFTLILGYFFGHIASQKTS